MKILHVSNNPKYEYDRDNKIGWNLLPSKFKKMGHKIVGIGKYELFSFYKVYKKFQPDIIVSTWVPAGFFPAFFKKINLVKCPIVHSYDEQSYAQQMPNYPRLIIKFIEDFVINNTFYFSTVSKINEEKLLSKRKYVRFIPHGYFKTNKKTRINLDKLKINKKNLKVIYLGEQSKVKMVDKLITAVKGLGCDLFLFGKTNQEFKKLETENVHFMGYIDEKEVHSVLKQADILANPSNMDVNYKFIEYIRAGKPILAYDGLPTTIFTHKVNAYLTKNFREGLKEIIKNKKLRKKLEKNVKKIKIYNWDEIAKMHLDFYADIINMCKKQDVKK